MIRFFASPSLSVILAGISLATIGTFVSLIAGLLASVYSIMKIIDWIEKRKNK